MSYAPIEDHGVVGDTHTAALVATDGSVDFMCFPHFDSPSLFAALLDDERGGRFELAPMLDGVRHRQLYLPDTNILLTRFLSHDGVAEISDFMPVSSRGMRTTSCGASRRCAARCAAACAARRASTTRAPRTRRRRGQARWCSARSARTALALRLRGTVPLRGR